MTFVTTKIQKILKLLLILSASGCLHVQTRGPWRKFLKIFWMLASLQIFVGGLGGDNMTAVLVVFRSLEAAATAKKFVEAKAKSLHGAAKAKSVKKTGNKVIKPKPAGGGGVFDVNMYKICSEPTLEEKAKEFKAKAKAKSMSRKPLHGAAKAKSAVKKTGNKVIKPKPAGGGTCTKSVLNPPWRCKIRSAPNGDPATYIKM